MVIGKLMATKIVYNWLMDLVLSIFDHASVSRENSWNVFGNYETDHFITYRNFEYCLSCKFYVIVFNYKMLKIC